MWRESVHFCVPYSETYVHRHIFHLEVFSTTDCLLPKDSGTCSGNFDNYYYNQQDKSCRVFQYGGCGGNSNNFKTKHECETKCLSKSFLDQHIQTDLSEHKTVLSPDINHLLCPGVNTAWKMSNYGVFSGSYFPSFGLNMERYGVYCTKRWWSFLQIWSHLLKKSLMENFIFCEVVSLRILSECGKIRTRKNFVFRHFSHSENKTTCLFTFMEPFIILLNKP